MPASRRSCSSTTCSLESPLRGKGDVLEVAAAAATGVRERARRSDAVRRRLEHLDRIATQEGLVDLGDLHDHPLARQRVPDEDDDVAGLDRLDHRRGADARDDVAAVGDRSGAGLDPVADLEGGAHRPVRPRRTSPGRIRSSSQSSRSLPTSEPRSW